MTAILKLWPYKNESLNPKRAAKSFFFEEKKKQARKESENCDGVSSCFSDDVDECEEFQGLYCQD